MFSQACVKNFVHGGVYTSIHWVTHPLGRHPPPQQTPSGQTPPWADPRGRHPSWADTPPGQTPLLGRHPPGQTPIAPGRHPQGRQPPPQQTATAADGTHPIGMHSCFQCLL